MEGVPDDELAARRLAGLVLEAPNEGLHKLAAAIIDKWMGGGGEPCGICTEPCGSTFYIDEGGTTRANVDVRDSSVDPLQVVLTVEVRIVTNRAALTSFLSHLLAGIEEMEPAE